MRRCRIRWGMVYRHAEQRHYRKGEHLILSDREREFLGEQVEDLDSPVSDPSDSPSSSPGEADTGTETDEPTGKAKDKSKAKGNQTTR